MHRCKHLLSNPKPISQMRFVGFFLFAANPNENKKEKMERENRQWGLRLWSKTNLTFGKVCFEAQI